MRLFDLVEQEDRVRPAPDGLGEAAAFFVSDVAGRRADEARDRVLFHELGHVDADHCALVIEQELGERLAELGLADAGGSEEEEGADGAVGVLEAGACAADGVADGGDGLVLPDDSPLDAVLHIDELFLLAFEEPCDGDARPLRDDLGDVLGPDLLLEEPAVFLELDQLVVRGCKLALELGYAAVSDLGNLVEFAAPLEGFLLALCLVDRGLELADVLDRALLVLPARLERAFLFPDLGQLLFEVGEPFFRGLVLFFLQRLALDFELHYLAGDGIELDGHRVDLHPESRRGLVDEVDGLVGEESAADVAVGQCRGGDERGVLDADAVVHVVAFLEPAQDGDGVLDARLADGDGLEAAFERGVLFDVFAVFVERGRADAPELAARERGLEHV